VAIDKIVCVTGYRNGSAKEHVVVNYDENGIAKQVELYKSIN